MFWVKDLITLVALTILTVFESAHSLDYFHLDGWVPSISGWLLEVLSCNTKLSLSPSSDLSALHNEKRKKKNCFEKCSWHPRGIPSPNNGTSENSFCCQGLCRCNCSPMSTCHKARDNWVGVAFCPRLCTDTTQNRANKKEAVPQLEEGLKEKWCSQLSCQ